MSVFFKSICAVALFVLVSGCGGNSGTKLGYVSGKVTLDGQPLTGATVTIAPDNGSPSTGFVDKNGQYTMAYKIDRPGATVGTHKVLVTLPIELPPMKDNIENDEVVKVMEKAAASTGIPKKWRDGTSTITVKPGANTFDIEMTKESASG